MYDCGLRSVPTRDAFREGANWEAWASLIGASWDAVWIDWAGGDLGLDMPAVLRRLFPLRDVS